jgi:hypothetical protein
MKKIIILATFIAYGIPVCANANNENITAGTITVNAATVNILPSLSEQALIQQYKHPWWINVGGGLTTGFHSEDPVNAGYDASINLQPTHHQMLSLRTAGADFIGGDYYDVGLLYGLISRNLNGYISGELGIGGVFFTHDFLGRHDNTSTVGMPMEIQAFWTPVPNFGLGLIAYANVNSEHSYYGSVLALQLANLIPV